MFQTPLILSVWTSLEIVKLIVSVLTPLILIILGFLINQRLKHTDFLQWTNQKVIEKRLAIFDEIAPLLNDLYCFFTYVGRWKELTPPKVIDLKRRLDHLAHIYAPIFDRNFMIHYTRFMDCCFLTFQGWGEDAKLRTDYAQRKKAAGKSWKQIWSSIFAEEITDQREIEACYQDLMLYLSQSLGVCLLEGHPETTATTDSSYSESYSSGPIVSGDDDNHAAEPEHQPPSKKSHETKLSESDQKGLQNLRKRIRASGIPERKSGTTLNIATWNIREFCKRARKRLSLHLIAEIINQFDLVSVVELRDNVTDLDRLLRILGPHWHVVYSDLSRNPSGNVERVAYVYDEQSVMFTGLAGGADPYRKKKKVTVKEKAAHEYRTDIPWWLSPFMASFRVVDFDFVVITTHIRWPKTGGVAGRKQTLQLLANWVDMRSKEKQMRDKDVIIIGNFNIPKVDGALYKAITNKGLRIPHALVGQHGSNLARDKSYDQILHYPKRRESFTGKGGVLDFYTGDIKGLFLENTPTKAQFFYQLSDHFPLWIQIDIAR